MRRGRLRLAGVAVTLLAAGAIAWHALVIAPAVPAVSVSAASAASARSKMQGLDAAKSQAAKSRQPVPVAETFTDSELSSVANEQAQAKSLPFSHLVLHSTAAGSVLGLATVHVAGQDVPVSLEVVPSIAGGRVTLNVTRVQVGSVPLPGPIADQVTQTVRQSLNVGLVPEGFQQVRLQVTEGLLTISGVAIPSS